MTAIVSRYWWLFLLRGIVGILFGVLCIVQPQSMSLTLLLVWGSFVLVDGVFALAYALLGNNQMNRWLLGLQGVLGICIGIAALANPLAAALAVMIYISAWSFLIGSLTIVAAIVYRQEIKGEFWLGLAGVMSILFGLYVIFNPGAAAISLVWVLGFFALASGIATVAFAFRLKRHAKVG